MTGDARWSVTPRTGAPLPQLQGSLRTLVTREGGVDVDVSFGLPRDTSARSATLNFFLFDLEERTDTRDVLPRHDRAGRLVLPPRRLDVRYHVCVPGGSEEDAAALLWRVTALFLRHPELPEDLVPEALRPLGVGVSFQVAQPGDRARLRDFPGAQTLPPVPFVVLTATVPMDLEVMFERRLVVRREIRTGPRHEGEDTRDR